MPEVILVSNNRHDYEYDVDLDGSTAPAHVIRMVGSCKRVLEVGAGPGSITRILKERGNCRVTGLEIDQEAVNKLEQYCERVYIADLNNPSWPEQLSAEEAFDVIVAADVLEHLYNPTEVLSAIAVLAGKTGEVVISLPHVGHSAIIACLLDEDFHYRDWGLLDRTHIRFFGLKNMQQLFEEANLKIVETQFVITPPEESELADKWLSLSNKMKSALSGHQYGMIYQVVIKAVSGKREDSSLDLLAVAAENQEPPGAAPESTVGLARKMARKYLSEKTRRQILEFLGRV